MTNIDKLLLFISYHGQDVSTFKKSYVKALKNSETVHLLEKNLIHAQNFGTGRVNQLIADYQNLNWNCPTFEAAVTLTTRITYLAGKSFERYYLNPLSIGSQEVRLSSLGELMFYFDGSLLSFNEIVLAKGYSFEYKCKAVDKQVAFYHAEMVNYLLKPIKKIIDGKKIKKRFSISFLVRMMEKIAFFAINFTIFILILLPKYKVAILEGPGYHSIGSKIIWIFLIVSFFYDFVYVIFRAITNKIYEPLSYSRRYLKVRKKTVFKLLSVRASKMASYFKKALIDGITLQNDIKLFAKFGDDSLDLDSVDKIKAEMDKKPYRLLAAFHNIVFGIAICALFMVLVFIIVYHFTQGDLL